MWQPERSDSSFILSTYSQSKPPSFSFPIGIVPHWLKSRRTSMSHCPSQVFQTALTPLRERCGTSETNRTLAPLAHYARLANSTVPNGPLLISMAGAVRRVRVGVSATCVAMQLAVHVAHAIWLSTIHG